MSTTLSFHNNTIIIIISHIYYNTKINNNNMESVQSWVSEHKLTTVGGLWASGIGASLIAYSRARSPMKPSLRLIHARMHAQALTLAVLSGAAAYHYYEKRSSDIAMANMEENTTTSSSVPHQWELLSPF